MAFYSDELIEEVRSRNDIVDVISGYVRLQKKGSDYYGLCPFHNEKTPSFSVSPRSQLYYCFGCGAGGNVISFVMQYENFTFQEAVRSLAGRAGIQLPREEPDERQRRAADRRSRLLEIQKAAGKYYYQLLRDPRDTRALDYFRERALTKETMQKFGLGYSGRYSGHLYQYLKKSGYEDGLLRDSGLILLDEKRGGYDRFWNRAMFPIMDANSRVIGFGGRVMGEGEPKYLNSPETDIFDKSRNLYGLHLARRSRRSMFLLCEGYMDVIALHQAGFDNAVASLGTSFTPGHAGLLKRYTKEVYLTFDSDGAGVKAALRAIPILKEAGLQTKVVDMAPHKDPDEFIKALGAEAFEERIERAENSFLFEIRMLKRDYDLSDPDAKTAFFREAARKVLTFEDELERENYIQVIAQTYGAGFEQFRAMVNREGARGGMTRERPVVKSGRKDRSRPDAGVQSQRLFLTWLAEEPRLFELTERYIGPDDFTDELCRKVADALYEQHRSGQTEPARIVGMFADGEQQREAAAIFHARIPPMETRQEREKALKEIIVRMKKTGMEYRAGKLEPTDLAGLQRLVEDRRKLAELERSQIFTEE